MTPALILRAEGVLRRERGRVILGPIHLAVAAGEALAVVGPNGAGKTTLLRLLAGLLPPSDGRVLLAGRDLAATPRRTAARRLVYLPQHPPLAVPLTVERYLLLARYPHGREEEASVAARMAAALAATDLAALRDRPLAALSGGERQLVQLAGALVQGGDVWLVDEPTAHLDPAHQRRVARLLAALHGQAADDDAEAAGARGAARTLLLATHDLNLAAHLATRVVALVDGAVAADGPPAEVLAPARLQQLYGAPFAISGSGDARRVWLEL
ncbi:MAG TPA: ABC transporter ATP-binding protein [Thermoanaerobaculia bacterium]|nr:ABC transporter ATP-binding protein [Thermoanaerobaculia bacterium]